MDKILTKNQFELLDVEARNAAIEAMHSLEQIHDISDNIHSKKHSVLFLIWILALLSLAIELQDHEWQSYSANICELGYRIPDESYDELFPDFLKIHEYLLEYHNSIPG